MPEIGEVGRIVHYLLKHTLNKTISRVLTTEDDIVYGKVGTSASAFAAALTGKKILGARQQGKYFWLELSSPPHPLMHLGMTGWIKFSNDDSSYYKPAKKDEDVWPPRFWKFCLQFEEGDGEVAFVDARRLARIRLVDAKREDMRLTSPLKENGPDPVQDKEILTKEWLGAKLKSKRVPVKALLLDQGNISGVGNWVADEVLYQARIHPEQYSNTFSDEQVGKLHDSLIMVCTTAVETLSDSSKFPEDWLMKHRWGKGKKDQNRLPNGDKIDFLTVGGRTSAIVSRLQKKTGPVAGDVTKDSKGEVKSESAEESEAEEAAQKPAKGKSQAASKKANGTSKAAKKEEPEGDEANSSKKSPKAKAPSKRGRAAVEEDADEGGAKSGVGRSAKKSKAGKTESKPAEPIEGRRRSTRLSRG